MASAGLGFTEAGTVCFWSLDIGASLGPRVAGGSRGASGTDITSRPGDAGARMEPDGAGTGFGAAAADTTSWATHAGAGLELWQVRAVFCPPGVAGGARRGRGDARASFGPSEEGGTAARGPRGARASLGSRGTGAALSLAGS